jgi:hypothetical protein
MKRIYILLIFLSSFELCISQSNSNNKLPKEFISFFVDDFKIPKSQKESGFTIPLNETKYGGIDTIEVNLSIKNGVLQSLNLKYDIINVFIDAPLKQSLNKYNYLSFKDGNYKFFVYIIILRVDDNKQHNFEISTFKDDAFWFESTQTHLKCKYTIPSTKRSF